MCPFCLPNPLDRIFQTAHFYAIFDRAPVTDGHILIISKEHRQDLFDLNQEEYRDLCFAVQEAKLRFFPHLGKPDGFNIGANCGEAAGQSVMHFHLHVIPRRKGDIENPRGGIRNLMKSREELWPEGA